MPDCLDKQDYSDETDEGRDPRSRIQLRAFDKLTHIDLEGVWVLHWASETFDMETDSLRLVTMLPKSVQDLTLRINAQWTDAFHDAMVSALTSLVVQYQNKIAFPRLQHLSLFIVPRLHLTKYGRVVSAAEAAGLKVQAVAHEIR